MADGTLARGKRRLVESVIALPGFLAQHVPQPCFFVLPIGPDLPAILEGALEQFLNEGTSADVGGHLVQVFGRGLAPLIADALIGFQCLAVFS
jgi:hypothetical protein